jgi:catechol 2,3-dioxygenase-like lactoylglutathione lyase family enzyme
VRDVRAASQWYAQLLGGATLPGGSDHDHVYDRVMCGEVLLLQLHSWDDEAHPNLVDEKRGPKGHGVLVWFEVDDFDAAVKRARALEAEVIEEPHFNPGPRHRELWLRDRDGYVVVIASPDGESR